MEYYIVDDLTGLWNKLMEETVLNNEERWGKIVITFDNGHVMENDGWTQEDGDHWTDWVADGTPIPDNGEENPPAILGINGNRVLAIEWIADD